LQDRFPSPPKTFALEKFCGVGPAVDAFVSHSDWSERVSFASAAGDSCMIAQAHKGA
jgi:hypothetical protein